MAKPKSDVNKICINIAQEAHKNQIRAGTGKPYIIHPKRVAKLVEKEFKEHPKIDILICAALLHDVIEDSAMTKEKLTCEVGEEIANLVQELTEEKKVSSHLTCSEAKKFRHKKYKQKLYEASNLAKILKLCDIYDNSNDFPPSINFLDRCTDIVENLSLSKDAILYEQESFADLKKRTLKLINDAKTNFKKF